VVAEEFAALQAEVLEPAQSQMAVFRQQSVAALQPQVLQETIQAEWVSRVISCPAL
jgi:hypothetical protein